MSGDRRPVKLLLDTHVVLWWLAGTTRKIGANARRSMLANEARVTVSAVTVWEIAIKRGLGKLEAPLDLVDRLERARVELLPVTVRHADAVAGLSDHHRDPFDRLLVAQATIEGMAVVTGDPHFAPYGVDVVW